MGDEVAKTYYSVSSLSGIIITTALAVVLNPLAIVVLKVFYILSLLSFLYALCFQLKFTATKLFSLPQSKSQKRCLIYLCYRGVRLIDAIFNRLPPLRLVYIKCTS